MTVDLGTDSCDHGLTDWFICDLGLSRRLIEVVDSCGSMTDWYLWSWIEGLIHVTMDWLEARGRHLPFDIFTMQKRNAKSSMRAWRAGGDSDGDEIHKYLNYLPMPLIVSFGIFRLKTRVRFVPDFLHHKNVHLSDGLGWAHDEADALGGACTHTNPRPHQTTSCQGSRLPISLLQLTLLRLFFAKSIKFCQGSCLAISLLQLTIHL